MIWSISKQCKRKWSHIFSRWDTYVLSIEEYDNIIDKLVDLGNKLNLDSQDPMKFKDKWNRQLVQGEAMCGNGNKIVTDLFYYSQDW